MFEILVPLYFGIGFIWATIVSIVMLDEFGSTKDALMCFGLNLFFWPISFIMAAAMTWISKGK